MEENYMDYGEIIWVYGEKVCGFMEENYVEYGGKMMIHIYCLCDFFV